ncbi:MAG: gamma-glutamyltransferase family protein [Polyangiaceae bacterium]|nr:gamma-glutamyltransferase family protein [Polyangiaceae bacterium]
MWRVAPRPGPRTLPWRGVVAAVALGAGLVAAAPRLEARPAGGKLAVATEHEVASREALRVLEAGGNAVDAAVTAALVAGVVSPSSSGLGGGGFALAWSAERATPTLLDFRETAPAGVVPAEFEARPFEGPRRGRYVGVPGEARGLHELHRRLGKRPWGELVAPAVRVARTGFAVSRHLAGAIAGTRALADDPALSRTFLAGGKPAAVGQLVKNEPLAATLERLAAEGPTALTEGAAAAEIEATVRGAGGTLTAAELAAYQVVERQPLLVRWQGYDVYTMPPPSAGGMTLAQALGMLEPGELRRLGGSSGAYQHLLAEVLRGALADRMRYLGDPDHVEVDLGELLSPARLAARRRKIALDRTHGIPRFGLEEHGTHHLITADARGNVVSLTTTVNRAFGARLATPTGGVVLNDELDDFTAAADVRPFDLKESPNRARAGARPVSSMTPTIVLRDGKPVLAIGGSGGPTITTNVTQLVLARLVFGTAPAALVAGRRFYVPTRGAYLWLEKGAPPELIADLEARGEIVGEMPFTTSAVQAIAFEGGRAVPASDPRKGGSALAR